MAEKMDLSDFDDVETPLDLSDFDEDVSAEPVKDAQGRTEIRDVPGEPNMVRYKQEPKKEETLWEEIKRKGGEAWDATKNLPSTIKRTADEIGDNPLDAYVQAQRGALDVIPGTGKLKRIVETVLPDDYEKKLDNQKPTSRQVGSMAATGMMAVAPGSALQKGAKLGAKTGANIIGQYGSNTASHIAQGSENPFREGFTDTLGQGPVAIAGEAPGLTKRATRGAKQLLNESAINKTKQSSALDTSAKQQNFNEFVDNPEKIGPDAHKQVVKANDEVIANKKANEARSNQISEDQTAYKQKLSDYNETQKIVERNLEFAQKRLQKLHDEAFTKQLDADGAFIAKTAEEFEGLRNSVDVAQDFLGKQRQEILSQHQGPAVGDFANMVQVIDNAIAEAPAMSTEANKLRYLGERLDKILTKTPLENMTRAQELAALYELRTRLGADTNWKSRTPANQLLQKTYGDVSKFLDQMPEAPALKENTNNFGKTYRIEGIIDDFVSREQTGKMAVLDDAGNVIDPAERQRVKNFSERKGMSSFANPDAQRNIMEIVDNSGNVPMNQQGTPLVPDAMKLKLKHAFEKASPKARQKMIQDMKATIESKRLALDTSIEPRPQAPQAPVEPAPVPPISAQTEAIQGLKNVPARSKVPLLDTVRDYLVNPALRQLVKNDAPVKTALDLVADKHKLQQAPPLAAPGSTLPVTTAIQQGPQQSNELKSNTKAQAWLSVIGKAPHKAMSREAVASAARLYKANPQELEQALISLGIQITP